MKTIFRHDLLKHFFIGTLFLFLLLPFGIEPYFIASFAFVLGWGKELHDLIKKGKASLLDVIYTVAPSLIYTLISLI